MRFYIAVINIIQRLTLGLSIGYLILAPMVFVLVPELFSELFISRLFTVSLVSVTFVMAIRPLADLLPSIRFLRPLVILRKGIGVLSASIVLGFTLAKLALLGPVVYFTQYANPAYWSLDNFILFAHVGEVTAFILLITSNNFSQRILGKWWKRIQKLAYVYFYSGASYELFAIGSTFALYAIVVVTTLVLFAALINRRRRLRTRPPARGVSTAFPRTA